MKNRGFVNLLLYFEDKCCAIRQDIIYAVLSLSREAEALKVNYQSPTSENVLQTVNICHDSQCLCTLPIVV